MKLQTAITGTILAAFIYVALFWLCSCTSDPRYYGMDAARMTGQTQCLAYKHNGELRTAAIFPCSGRHYVYEPSQGSAALPLGRYRLMDYLPGVMVIPVFAGDNTNIPNGCLPRAIAEVRAKGGHVEFGKRDGYTHAYRVP